MDNQIAWHRRLGCAGKLEQAKLSMTGAPALKAYEP
jgi:hypothetical protein